MNATILLLRLLSLLLIILALIDPAYPVKIIADGLFSADAAAFLSYSLAVASLLVLAFSFFPAQAARLGGFLQSKIASTDERKIAAAIFVLGFILKFTLSFAVPENFYYHDGAQYSSLAYSLYTGKGYVTDTLWAVMLGGNPPMQDIYRAPMEPFMIYVFYMLFGPSFFSEKLLSVFLGALIPALVFVLSTRIFAGKSVALLSAALAFFSWIIFAYSRVIHTELAMMVFTLLFFIFLVNFRYRLADYLLLGIAFSASYLTRYQALYILPVVAAIYFYAGTRSVKKTVQVTAIILIVFAAITLPWFFRMYSLTGDPFYSDLKYIASSEFHADPDYYLYSLDTPKESFLDVALSNPASMAAAFVARILTQIKNTPLYLLDPVTTLLFLTGIVYALPSAKKEYWAILAYITASYAFLSVFFSVARHLQPLIPFMLVFSAFGAKKLYETAGSLRTWIICILVLSLAVNLALIAFAYQGLDKRGESSKNTYSLFQDYIRPNGIENVTFMVDSFPYFYDYYSRGAMRVVQFPYYSNYTEFQAYIAYHNVSYIVLHQDSILKIPHTIPDIMKGNISLVYSGHERNVYRLNE